MVNRLIVPVDGSPVSWRAAEIALDLGRRCDAPVMVVEVVFSTGERPEAVQRMADGVSRLGLHGVDVEPRVELGGGATVGEALATLIGRHPESTVVMASHGRGRSAALLGSVTDELLQREFGPIVVVGPDVRESRWDGPLLVTVDGSDLSEHALPLAAAWAIELGVRPWIIEVNEPGQPTSEHLVESSYPARLARHLTESSGHQTEFEVLHGTHADVAVADFADHSGASLIVASTHGRTGLSRLRIGSTAAGFVRRATCPVLLVRPPSLATTGEPTASATIDT